MTPLILLQEQLRPNLPMSTKVKLISQNAFYVKDAKPRKPSEWKLACFLHQIVRLTLSLWQTVRMIKNSFLIKLKDKEDGNLQVFVHNDLLNLLGSFFYADTGSVLLNMIGLSSSSEPSIEFQLFVKALQELVSNFCKGLNRENLQEVKIKLFVVNDKMYSSLLFLEYNRRNFVNTRILLVNCAILLKGRRWKIQVRFS